MKGSASRGHRPHPFDLLMLFASFGIIGWIVLAH
jgi:hypothetical protein